jgi:hypothetical protein
LETCHASGTDDEKEMIMSDHFDARAAWLADLDRRAELAVLVAQQTADATGAALEETLEVPFDDNAAYEAYVDLVDSLGGAPTTDDQRP